ncbi:MAG: histidinol phosphatase [Acidimicrobiia bacterium]|nr:histidinol phosphatase [Acidimicrobiia bacterium]
MDLASDLRLALAMADAADAITVPRFRAPGLVVEAKPDRSPVTEADRDAEQAMRSLLAQERPGDGVLGEEFGAVPSGDRRWILDPIDGTINYLRGIPVWGTLIALEQAGKVVVGVVSAPLLGRRWWASRDGGAFSDGASLRVSRVEHLADAQLSYNAQVTFEEAGWGPQGLALSRRCWRTRGFGDFWSHLLVAEGAVDLSVDPVAAVWDLAPLQVIVEEAGGRFSDFSGVARLDGGNAVSSNSLVHEAALAILNDPNPQVPPRSGPVVA